MAKTMNTRGIKIALTGLAAIAAMGATAYIAKPPPLTSVAVLKTSVAGLSPVTSQQITWVKMEHPPLGTITAWDGDPLTTHALAAGTVLTQADFTSTRQVSGLKHHEVQYLVSITPASAVIKVGQRVDVWSQPPTQGSTPSSPQELATGVRVMGLYTSTGLPVAGSTPSGGLLSSSSTNNTPALVALAVPSSHIAALIAANPQDSALLVNDPTKTQFTLTAGASTGSLPSSTPQGTSLTPSKTTHSAKAAG